MPLWSLFHIFLCETLPTVSKDAPEAFTHNIGRHEKAYIQINTCVFIQVQR